MNKKGNGETMKKLWNRIARYRVLLLLSIVLAAATVIMQLYVPMLFGDAIDCIVAEHRVDFDRVGMFLGRVALFAVLSGISGWQLSDFAQELSKMQVAAEQARTGVEIRNREALCAIIKSKTEAYIWDKAQELDLSVSIEVMVEANGSYPYPSGVQITGAFTPQQRKALEAYIEENLAIGKERQIWTNE